LEKLGVRVLTDHKVEQIEPGVVTINGRPVPTATIVWGAGVTASPAGKWLGVPTDRAGRIMVRPDLSVPDRPGVYALGDTAVLNDADGNPLPGLAQVAKQQGTHLGRALAAELTSGQPVPPFQFRNRGNTAIIGRHAAVFDFGKARLKGFIAWVLWAIVHIYLLVSFRKRLLVSVQWLWRYITYQSGARLIENGGAAVAAKWARVGTAPERSSRTNAAERDVGSPPESGSHEEAVTLQRCPADQSDTQT
jgi:NADH dehydrogenase